MKNLFLTVFLCYFFGLNVNAQVRFGNVRCDSFKVTVDTSRAVIYRKKKAGVFDKKINKFLIKPTKDVIFYFDEVDYYLRVGKKEITPIYILKNGELQRIENSNSDTLLLDFPHVGSTVLKNVVRIQDRFLYNYEKGLVIKDEFPKDYFRVEKEIKAYRKGNFLYVKNSQFLHTGLNHSETSTIIDSGYTKSGIYDLDERIWSIPPVYESCYWQDNFVFCLKREAPKKNEVEERKYRYDIYKAGENEMALVLQDVYEDEQIEISEIFGCDSVSVTAENSYYTTWKNGKQGLVKFSLFRTEDLNTGKPEFACQKLLDEKFDFVLLGLDYGYVITYKEDAENRIVAYTRSETDKGIKLNKVVSANNELVWGTMNKFGNAPTETEYIFQDDKNLIHIFANSSDESKGKIWVEDELEVSIKSDMTEAFFSRAVGLRVLDSNYLQVIHFKSDSIDLIPIQNIYDEDSVSFSEELDMWVVIYPEPIPGYFYSGIFDYSSGEWLVSPEYGMIYKNEQGFLLESYKFHTELGHIENNLYSFVDNSGDFVFRDKATTAVESHISYLLNTTDSERIMSFPEKVGLPRQIEAPGEYYYVKNEAGYRQVYQPFPSDYYVNPKPLTKPKEFVHYNAYYDYYFWLEQDSIYLEIYESVYSVHTDQGKIRLLIEDHEGAVEYTVESIQGNDTSSYKSYLFQNENNLSEIYIKDGKLILNENQIYDNITPYEEYLEGIYKDYFEEFDNDIPLLCFQTEISSIWEKKDGVWMRQTPYYASVEPIHFGYLVSTGDYDEIVNVSSHELISFEGRFLILDKNYKAMSFLDFYDFEYARQYDEGVMICLNQGCFFVNNSGKVLTHAEWSDFEIENGKLKAIKHNEEWGEDFEDMIEKVEYFDLE